MFSGMIDLILLTAMVLFFWWEQRRRPELFFRFWLAGWVLVLLSLVTWDFRATHAVGLLFEECVRQDALVCGGLAFIFSFLVSERRWRLPLRACVVLAVPICVALDLIAANAAPKPVMYGLIVVGEMLSIATAHRYMRKIEVWFFPAMLVLCVGSGLCLCYSTSRGELGDVQSFVFAEIFVAAGMLFSRSGFKGGRLVGGIGFFTWGLFYTLTASVVANHAVASAIYVVWDLPKYVVGLGMVLTIFEEAHAEITRLSVGHQRLYEEYRVLFMSNPHPMWIYDVETRYFLAVNDAAVAAYGFSEAQFLRMKVESLEVEEDAGRRRHRRADGTELDVEVTDRDMMFRDRAARFMLAVDITERENLNRELVRRAHHDHLTGLPNRAVLDDRIEQCLSRCIREDKKGAVLTVDIDHFKNVNDTYGHLIGDECLKSAAIRLSSRVRQVDTIARTGGEEFTIVVGGLANREAAEKVCAGMLRLFDKPVTCGEHELRVTVSIGVAMFPDHAIDIEGLRRRSDQALYEAKRMGRNRAVFASTVNV